ncbi:isochorismatase (plasmid) [blood disease bacterium A2-HR MARDI]|uniref:Isochorismatase n=1 Tax=blood disease bacterium A2-HR MARDI TaxID=1944648 RepID=A0A1U9VM64_9RALS|nr:isochorismatase [blood disease bacterium A2-HR MARDI]
MNPIHSPYTVSVYPIEQEPGIWFATYLISEYRDGMEHILANVSMRPDVHDTEAQARHAARRAGSAAIARLPSRQAGCRPQPHRAAHSAVTGAQHG